MYSLKMRLVAFVSLPYSEVMSFCNILDELLKLFSIIEL